jgi:uncharacterized protein YdcH (DUF465 family)
MASTRPRQSTAQQTSGNTLYSAGDSPQACRTNNQLDQRINNLNNCRDPQETARIEKFAENTYKIKDDFQAQTALYNDLILTGDNLFGTSPTNLQVNEIKKRNQELKDMKEKLQSEINAANSATERAERDFLDTKAGLPDPLPKKMIHTIEDYTMLVFVMSFVLMLISFIYLYSAMSGFTTNSIITGIVAAIVVSVILTILIYNIL